MGKVFDDACTIADMVKTLKSQQLRAEQNEVEKHALDRENRGLNQQLHVAHQKLAAAEAKVRGHPIAFICLMILCFFSTSHVHVFL